MTKQSQTIRTKQPIQIRVFSRNIPHPPATSIHILRYPIQEIGIDGVLSSWKT